MISSLERLLVVVAHPDDEVLGCGGIIRSVLAKAGQVRVVILGEGSSCRFAHGMLQSDDVKYAIAQRRGFADAAMEALGVTDAVFGDLPCGRFDTAPIIDIGKCVEEHISNFRPDTIITHFGHDTNSDHRLTFNAVMAATRPRPGGVRNVLACEIPSSTEWRFVETFQPNCFVDISEYIDSKVAAFACYSATEARDYPFPRCEEGLRILARYRGMQAGLHHAEAFQIVRTIMGDH